MATKNMLIIGDSQVDDKKNYWGRLGRVMKRYFGGSWAVVLDGMSGMTAKYWKGTGLAKLRKYLKQKPQVVIIAIYW